MNLSGLAVAALRHLLFDPGLLDRMKMAILAQALDGGDRALGSAHRYRAGTDWASADKHRAGAAGSDAAAILGSLKADDVAQHPKKRHIGLDIGGERLAVNG